MIRWITNYTTQKFSFRKGEKKLIIFVFFQIPGDEDKDESAYR